MIDIDRFHDQLDSALTENAGPGRKRRPPVPQPTPAPAPAPRAAKPVRQPKPAKVATPAAIPAEPQPRSAREGAGPAATTVAELLELGLMDDAEVRMAAATDPRDALTWATMRALLHGDRDTATAALAKLRQAPGAEERYWVQRFWAAVEWGNGDERYEVLDHCRERAYRFDDVDWWGNLTLLLVVLGKHDEAASAFDEALGMISGRPNDRLWLDVLTNLIEAAAGLGDGVRMAAAGRLLRWPEGRMVVVGDGLVCKGSIERYRAFVHTAAGRWQDAEACFRTAEAAHRAIGAGPLVARTVQQASGCLAAA